MSDHIIMITLAGLLKKISRDSRNLFSALGSSVSYLPKSIIILISQGMQLGDTYIPLFLLVYPLDLF